MVCSRVGPWKEGIDQPVLGNGLLRSLLLSVFTIENNVCCMLIIYGLYYVEVGSFYDYFLNQFSHSVVSDSM